MSSDNSSFVEIPIDVGGSTGSTPPISFPSSAVLTSAPSLRDERNDNRRPPEPPPPPKDVKRPPPDLPDEVPGLRRVAPPPSYLQTTGLSAPPQAALPETGARRPGGQQTRGSAQPILHPNGGAVMPRIPFEFARIFEVLFIFMAVLVWTDATDVGAQDSVGWKLFFGALLTLVFAVMGVTLCILWDYLTHKPRLPSSLFFNTSLEDGFAMVRFL